MQKFADVILPLPLANSFTYFLPDEMGESVQRGCRVIVPFGRRKYYTAIVIDVHGRKPEGYEVKPVFEVLDARPVILPQQYEFWRWIAEYYLCTLGDVYKAALPSGMKLESETLIEYNEDFEAEKTLPPKEQKLLDLLSVSPQQCITQLEKNSGFKHILPIVNSLLEKGAVFVEEGMRRNYRPRVEIHVRLNPMYCSERMLNIQLNDLARVPKQQKLLLRFLDLVPFDVQHPSAGISRKILLEKSGVSTAVLSGLTRKGILETYGYEVGRLNGREEKIEEAHSLTVAQQKSLDEIERKFNKQQVCLLHGVTSCGKTEIYIHLMQHVVAQGKQVLFLLPEIALTTQITERLRRVFGNRLGVYHSKFPDAERVEIWQKQLQEQAYDVIVGVRSSVFLPFSNLGLVIVDEEHDGSYKQQDPAPRYNARNAAIMLASFYGAKTLLGTATPSVESYYNAQSGKYGLVTLAERFQGLHLPQVEVVDCKDLRRRKIMKGAFSPLLIEKMKEALERKEQIILFQNRRGFAPIVECHTCGWVPRCKNCDVSLTYHKGLQQLTCHYCGYTYQLPRQCPACEGTDLMHKGFGTERIEDEIRGIFPEARVARMDLDTTRSRSGYERIISDFEAGRTDILVGTQMVSKGLDFERVSVVGILDADSLLNFPDFRAYERAFQMMAQVSGRAGRKNKQGLVILQTKSPDLPLIHQVVHTDYENMYQDQLAERELFHYPPFYRLIYIYLKHRDENTLDSLAHIMASCLRQVFDTRILGPDKPPVPKVQQLYIRKIVLKIETGASLKVVRDELRQVQEFLQSDDEFRASTVYYDVDPV